MPKQPSRDMREPFPEALDKTRNVGKAALAAIERDTTRLEGRASTGWKDGCHPAWMSRFRLPPPRVRPQWIVHMCIFIRTDLRGWKGPGHPPGAPH